MSTAPPAPIDPEVKDRLDKLRRLNSLRKNYGIFAYRPSDKQERFHAAAKFTRRYLRTGNRFGKSTCGAAEDISYAIGARLWLPEGDVLRNLGIPTRATKGVILVADWDKAREVFTSPESGKLMKMIPKDRIEYVHKNQAGEVAVIGVKNIFGTISTIELDTIKSYMSNPMGQESSQWDWIHVDEPIPEAMWQANARGLIDTGGSAWFTCTPISEQWINEYFLPVSLIKGQFNEGFSWQKHPERWIMTGSSYDNPVLNRKDIDQFAGELNDAQRMSRIFGLPKASQGLVYNEFDQDVHVYTELPLGWEDFDVPPPTYTIRVFIDSHPRTPHAVHFWATSPTGEAYLYEEIFSTCGGLISGLCDEILKFLKGREVHEVLIEPAAFITNPTDGRSFADVFTEYGIDVEPAPKDLRNGITKAKNELKQPNFIHIASNCTETIREFYTYVWDKEKEKPVDKDDHMMECFYRACLVGLEWRNPERKNFDQRLARSEGFNRDFSLFAGGNLNPIAA